MLNHLVRNWRRFIRRLNWAGLFIEAGNERFPIVVIVGYTRSGTTFLGRLLAHILRARPVHEPLKPSAVPVTAFFNERESRALIESSERHLKVLGTVFGPGFRGSKYTNTGDGLFYRGRIIKIVRANHYLDLVSSMLPEVPIIVIVRNPCACIASRLVAGWPVPDHSHSFPGVEPYLNDAQRQAYLGADSKVKQLAVSWCLDNFMLLRNAGNASFCFLHYEDLVAHPFEVCRMLLSHIDRKAYTGNIEREVRLECNETSGLDYLVKWKKHLDADQVESIAGILRVFGLDGYYVLESGQPAHRYPFMNPAATS